MQPTPSSPAVNAWRRYFQIGKVSEGVRFFSDGDYESLIVRNKALSIHTYTCIYIYIHIYTYMLLLKLTTFLNSLPFNFWVDLCLSQATMTAEISTMRLDIGDIQVPMELFRGEVFKATNPWKIRKCLCSWWSVGESDPTSTFLHDYIFAIVCVGGWPWGAKMVLNGEIWPVRKLWRTTTVGWRMCPTPCNRCKKRKRTWPRTTGYATFSDDFSAKKAAKSLTPLNRRWFMDDCWSCTLLRVLFQIPCCSMLFQINRTGKGKLQLCCCERVGRIILRITRKIRYC